MSLKFCIRLWIYDSYQKSVKGLVIDVKESVTRLVTLMAVVFYSQRRHLAENWDIDNALLKAEELEALKLLLRFPTKVTNQVNEENCLHASTIFRASRNCVTTAAAPRLLHNVQNTLDRLYWSNISKVQKYTRWKTLNFLVGKNMQKFDKKDQREDEASFRHRTVFEKYIKKSHLIVWAKRAAFTFWVDKSSLKMPKIVLLDQLLKT